MNVDPNAHGMFESPPLGVAIAAVQIGVQSRPQVSLGSQRPGSADAPFKGTYFRAKPTLKLLRLC